MNNEIKPQSKLAREYQETKQDSQVRFLRYREGAAVYGMSQSSFEKLAKEAGAVYKVGKMALVRVDILDAYLEQLGYVEPDDINVTLANIMLNVVNDEENVPGYGILHHEEGVDLIPANIELSGLEVALTNVMSRETIMKSYLDTIRDQYDFILVLNLRVLIFRLSIRTEIS